jgi:phosphatidate cytidylyltransferase
VVADPDPATPSDTAARRGTELVLRVASALVLAPLAIATAVVGNWPFQVFWGLAAIGVFWEWSTLVAGKEHRPVVMVGAAAVGLACLLASNDCLWGAAAVIALGPLATAPLAPQGRRGWVAGGIPYAAAIGVASIALRADEGGGLTAMLFLFAIVWSTDIAAYFVGRLVGGPKLLPRVSPKKTWSGALGGLAAAVLAAITLAKLAGLEPFALAGIAAALSCLAQAGDLFESLLKRKFGAKDSSHLIPGHGGLMDRLDGFVFAAAAAVLVGILRGGLEAPAQGLLIW